MGYNSNILILFQYVFNKSFMLRTSKYKKIINWYIYILIELNLLLHTTNQYKSSWKNKKKKQAHSLLLRQITDTSFFFKSDTAQLLSSSTGEYRSSW